MKKMELVFLPQNYPKNKKNNTNKKYQREEPLKN
jgi:hypothetical protein